MTALTLYVTTTLDGTLTNAGKLVTVTGGAAGTNHTVIGTASGWGELGFGGNPTWASGAGPGTGDGYGAIWDVTTLEGQTFPAGTWTLKTTVSISAGSETGSLELLVYAYNSGVYTLKGSGTISSATYVSGTPTAVSIAASLAAASFVTGDKLYWELWFHSTAHTGTPTNILVSISNNATLGFAGAGELDTPGYGLTPVALSGTLAGVGTLAGTTQLSTALTSTLAGVGTLAATPSLATALTGTLAGVGTLSGTMQVSTALTATLAGVGTLSGTAQLSTALSDTLSGAGTLTGALSIIAWHMSDTLAGVGTLAGTFSLTTALSSTLAGVGTLSGTVSLNTALTDTLSGVGTLTGILGTTAPIALSVTLAGTGTLTPTLSANLALPSTTLAGVGIVAGALAHVYYVSTTGSDSNSGYLLTAAWLTLQHAAASIAGGDTVMVADGTYTLTTASGNVTITTDGLDNTHRTAFVSINYLGAKIVNNIVATNDSTLDPAFFIDANFVDVTGFEISGAGARQAINMYGHYNSGSGSPVGSYMRVRGCYIHDIGQTCNATYTNVTGIVDSQYSTGSAYMSKYNEASGNIVRNIGQVGNDGAHGIYFATPYGTIQNNIVSGCPGFGIDVFHFANHMTISDNLVFNCGTPAQGGPGLFGGGIYLSAGGTGYVGGTDEPCDYCTVTNNILCDNNGRAPIYEGNGGGNYASNNTFSNNAFFNNIGILSDTYRLESGATPTATPASTTISGTSADTFARANQSGWGTASDGEVWNVASGGVSPAISTLSIVSNQGKVTGSSANEYALLGSTTMVDGEILVRLSTSTTNTNNWQGPMLRFQGGRDYYTCFLRAGTTLYLYKSVGGTLTSIASAAFTWTANTEYWIRFNVTGSTVKGRVWANGSGEPGTWTATVTDTAITTAGSFGLLSSADASGTTTVFDSFSTSGQRYTTDPQFVNYQVDGSGDYHLMATSPCINAGTSVGAPSIDLDGNPRPLAGYDIGPYEMYILAGTLVGTGTLTGTLTLATALADSLPGVGTLAGTLSANLTLSGATLAGVGTLTGTMQLATTLASTLSGVGALSGTLGAAFALSGATLAGTGALTASPVTLSTALADTLAGTGALAGTAQLSTALTITLAGTGTLAGTVQLATALAGTLAGIGTLSGIIQVSGQVALIVTMAGVGALTGTLAIIAVPLAGTCAGSGTLSGTLSLATALSVSLAGTGTLVETLSANTPLSGTLSGVGQLSGTCSLATALAMTAAGVGQLSGTLSAQTALSGNFAGIGTLAGTLAIIAWHTSGTLAGLGSLTGSLSLSTALTDTMPGVGTLAGSVSLSTALTDTLAGAGALTGTLAANTSLSVSFVGAGTLDSTLAAQTPLSATLVGTGTLSGTLTLATAITVTFAGTGQTTGTLSLATVLTSTLTGTGTLSGTLFIAGAMTCILSGSGQLSGTIDLATALSLTFAGSGMLMPTLAFLQSLLATAIRRDNAVIARTRDNVATARTRDNLITTKVRT